LLLLLMRIWIRKRWPHCQPSPFFLGIEEIGGARKHLNNELKDAHGGSAFVPSTTLAWDQPGIPSHVSCFFCGNTGHSGSSSEESLQLHLKSEGAGLPSAEIKKLVKQLSHPPCDFHAAQDHLGNYHSLFAFATGTYSAITLCIKAQVHHKTYHMFGLLNTNFMNWHNGQFIQIASSR
jgi:hypothetical protein